MRESFEIAQYKNGEDQALQRFLLLIGIQVDLHGESNRYGVRCLPRGVF